MPHCRRYCLARSLRSMEPPSLTRSGQGDWKEIWGSRQGPAWSPRAGRRAARRKASGGVPKNGTPGAGQEGAARAPAPGHRPTGTGPTPRQIGSVGSSAGMADGISPPPYPGRAAGQCPGPQDNSTNRVKGCKSGATLAISSSRDAPAPHGARSPPSRVLTRPRGGQRALVTLAVVLLGLAGSLGAVSRHPGRARASTPTPSPTWTRRRTSRRGRGLTLTPGLSVESEPARRDAAHAPRAPLPGRSSRGSSGRASIRWLARAG